MTIEPPQPPTAPAPGVRPTPPTPPKIDRAPFVKDDSGTTNQTGDEIYENMARDAVANGSGALTKRTVDKGDNQNPPANQKVTIIPPDAPLVKDTQSDYDRGQDVLREFQEMDARPAQRTENFSYQTETDQPQAVRINHNEGNGAVFWIFTIIFVAVVTFFIAKKFLLTDKPQLTKSQLFDDKKTTTDKPPPPKPKPPKKDSKGKRFEVRI